MVSGNSKLLKVSSYTKDGAVTLKAQKKTGKTKLTVTLAGGAVKTVNVTIQKGTVKTTKISGVPKKITLKKGKKQTLAPILAPITTQQKVTYTTSNKKVCTVTKGGVITAKKKKVLQKLRYAPAEKRWLLQSKCGKLQESEAGYAD